MKRLERIIVLSAAALAMAGMTAGVMGLLSLTSAGRSEGVEVIGHEQIRQNAAADPSSPQPSLWRQDPQTTVMIFGNVARAGALTIPEQGLTLRGAVSRAGGFSDAAVGRIVLMRKDRGAIGVERAWTRADLENQAVPDVDLRGGDVVHVE